MTTELTPEARAYFATIGKAGGMIGGKTTGKSKARTKQQASRAAKTRWAKRKGTNETAA